MSSIMNNIMSNLRPMQIKRIGVTAALLFVLVQAASQPLWAEPWDAGTALVLEPWEKEVGIFNPLRLGLPHDMELNLHPLLFFAYPHISVKKKWWEQNNITISGDYALRYPTLLVKNISREGTGGILPPTSEPNQMVTLSAGALGSMALQNLMITLKLRYERTLGGEMEHIPTIDIAIAYPRTASFHTKQLIVAGIDFDGAIGGPFYYTVDFDLFFFPPMDPGSAIENKILLHWKINDSVRLLVGGKNVFGKYPWGNKIRFMPLIDVVFRW